MNMEKNFFELSIPDPESQRNRHLLEDLLVVTCRENGKNECFVAWFVSFWMKDTVLPDDFVQKKWQK